MSGSVNKTILVANLGKEPEIRRMQNGDEVATFSVATTESWKDKQTGERKEKTEWINIVVYSQGLVGVCKNYLTKGSKVYIEGKLQTRSYDDAKSGVKKYVTEVVLQGYDAKLIMLDSRSSNGLEQPTSNGQVAGSSPAASTNDFDDPDLIPF